MKHLIAIAVLPAVLAAAEGSASGTMTIEGKTFELKHAKATRIVDWTDKQKEATLLLLTDNPVPDSAVLDSGELMDLYRDGKVNGLKVEFTDDGQNRSYILMSNAYEGSISMSGTFDSAKELAVFTEKRIEGTMVQEPRKLGDTTYAFDVKFAADVAPRVIESEPTPADTAAAAKASSAKAYLAFIEAVRKGDKAKLLAMSPPERREMIDTPDFPEILKMVQAMMAKNIRVLKTTETGDKAILIASGIEDGKEQRGKITMIRQSNGSWAMERESWAPKE